MSNIAAAMKEMIRQQLMTLHTCLICKVLNVYANDTAKVHPLTMVQTAAGEVRQHQALDGVPIADQVKNTIKVGSICIVVFAERDIAKSISGEYALPSLARHHSLSDGLIIGTIGEVSGSTLPGTQWCVPLSAETNTAKTTVVDSETDAGKEVRVDVKLNSASDNLIRSTSNGLYAPGYTKTEIDAKFDGLSNHKHPTHTPHSKGFYKFANDGLGHVSDAEKVTKKDITDLGIPGQDTTYTGGSTNYGTISVENAVITLSKAVGMSTAGKTYTIDDAEVIAYEGAEIFNNYDENIASGHHSHAEGSYTEASGHYSHAEGFDTEASGRHSHAEGDGNIASGDASHAEGFNTHARGWCSHAEGFNVEATGSYSHAEGESTSARSDLQHVLGKYNLPDFSNKYVFIIGNGTDNASRSNAIKIDWNGNIYCYGDTTSLNAQIDANTKKLSGIADNANNYVHPTTSGNKHIPSGGSSGQILRWSADGTAVWGKDNNTIYTAGTGLSMSGTTINHSNSVTAKTTADLIKVKHDAQGHITGTADVAASDVSALINKLTTAGSTPTDADYYICQYAGGGTTTTTYHRRPMSALWEYVKSKISSVLGLTASTYGGKSATATKLATARAIKIGNTSKKFDGSADATWTLAEIGAAAASHTHSQLHTHTTKSTNYGTLTASSNQLLLTAATGMHTGGKTYTYNNKSYSGSEKSEVFNDYASNMAANDYAHVEGCDNKGLANCCHVEGWKNVATGVQSHAGGTNSTASGEGSFVHGYQCTATTPWSVAMGSICTSSNANCAFTFGWGLTNLIGNSTVVGQWNAQNNAGLFAVGKGTSSAKANAFRVASDGKTYATGAYSSTGADYAEMFEWLDGNPAEDDRRGHFVTLDGEKIKFAESIDDDIIGVVSAAASIVGDAYEDGWNGMYLTDIFGGNLYDEPIIDEDGNEHTYQTLNPDYDPNVKYIPRSERPEWDAVGMMGKLVVVDDGTCQVNSYCVPTTGGIATKSDGRVGYRVLSRIDDTHVKILMR